MSKREHKTHNKYRCLWTRRITD